MRRTEIHRKTRETDIRLSLDIDGTGTARIETGIPFFDHMLESFARHGRFDLGIEAAGDLAVDAHHTIEDIGIALGKALAAAGIRKPNPLNPAHAWVLRSVATPYLKWLVARKLLPTAQSQLPKMPSELARHAEFACDGLQNMSLEISSNMMKLQLSLADRQCRTFPAASNQFGQAGFLIEAGNDDGQPQHVCLLLRRTVSHGGSEYRLV